MTTRKLSQKKGYIVAIGGAEHKDRNPEILKKFTQLCTQGDAHIAIIPTASELKDTGSQYQEVFHRLGAKRTDVLNIKRRLDCESPSILKLLSIVDGVFITGGDQSRLADIMGGTSLIKTLKEQNQQGLHIAGTSAGAAFISKNMISGGKSGTVPHTNMVELSTGAGLSQEIIFDQHFRQRHRLGRLITAIAINPESLGIGIDENTAIFIDQDNKFQVVGSGWVSIVDPTNMKLCEIRPAKRRQQISIDGLKLHLLINGDSYDIKARQVTLC